MYLEFFGLSRKPFSKTPDPAFLYPSRQHAEALARLSHAVDEREIAVLTGEVGTGKTTLSRALIDELSKLLKIDPKRVYATGFSNGAIFAYRLACELSDRIAAIGPVAATQILDDQQACRPTRSVPIIHFHGTADRLNPYDGGTTSAGYEFLSAEEAMRFWVKQNACPAAPQKTETGSIQHEVYAPCAQNSAVELCRILEGEHAWPGGGDGCAGWFRN